MRDLPTSTRDAGLRDFLRVYFGYVAVSRLRRLLVHCAAAAVLPLAFAAYGELPRALSRLVGAVALVILAVTALAVSIEWWFGRQVQLRSLCRISDAPERLRGFEDPASRRSA